MPIALNILMQKDIEYLLFIHLPVLQFFSTYVLI